MTVHYKFMEDKNKVIKNINAPAQWWPTGTVVILVPS